MLVYLICYIVSFILAWQHIYVLSGLVLLGAALWLYIKDYMRTGNLIHLRGLFYLFFVGGQGISCFKAFQASDRLGAYDLDQPFSGCRFFLDGL